MRTIKKNILLWAPAFYSLHIQLIKELKSLNYNVTFLADELQKYNPNFSTSSFSIIKRIYYKYFNPNKKYVLKNENIWDKDYDIIMVINGYSFDKYLINKLKKRNPKLKSILYLWDGIGFYNFSPNFKYFDIVYTFDSKDAYKYKIKFLPLFWDKVNSYSTDYKYDLCFIGTSHSDRCSILEKIEKQCNTFHISNYIRLVVKPRKITFLDYLKYLYYKIKTNPNAVGYVNDYLFLTGKKKEEFLTIKPLSREEFEEILEQSKCVLDLELPYQSGITHRMITALACKKKIITTNSSVKEYPFYNEDNIYIIDRNTPVLDFDFIKREYVESINDDYIRSLQINKWLKKILEDE